MSFRFMRQIDLAKPLLMACLLAAPIAAQAGSYRMLHAFQSGTDGALPEGKLTPEGDALYGATYVGGGECDCGTVYRIKEDGAENVIHAFAGGSSDGAYPEGGLAVLNGALYGATNGGGVTYCPYGPQELCGTVYEISTQGTLRIVHFFSEGGGSNPLYDLLAAHGAVWGTSFFSGDPVFKTAPSGKTTSYIPGSLVLPTSALVASSGAFFGTTQQGSQYCNGIDTYCGTVYKMTRKGQFSTVYEFTGGTDGRYPGGTLAQLHRSLFGTSEDDTGGGAVFAISPSGAETTLHAFAGGNDGSGSNNGLFEYEGRLYGTSPAGGGTGCGGDGCGTIFSVTARGDYKVLYRFKGGTDGQRPQGQLVAWHGALYGTTTYGGGTGCNGNGCGTVFRIRP